MATITCSKKEGTKVKVEALLDYGEYLQLKGHLDNIYILTENIAEVKANISQRGKNEATKYFLIPRQLRKGFKFNNATSCQRFDLKDKVLFVYIIDKLRTTPPRRESTLRKRMG